MTPTDNNKIAAHTLEELLVLVEEAFITVQEDSAGGAVTIDGIGTLREQNRWFEQPGITALSAAGYTSRYCTGNDEDHLNSMVVFIKDMVEMSIKSDVSTILNTIVVKCDPGREPNEYIIVDLNWVSPLPTLIEDPA